MGGSVFLLVSESDRFADGREFLHRRLAEAAPGIGLHRSHEYHLATDQGGGGYCVNILAEHQRGICLRLATPGGGKLCDVAWTPSPAGHPILDGALGWLECAVEIEYTAGDHDIVISRVLRLGMLPVEQPLILYQGGYGRFEATESAGLR